MAAHISFNYFRHILTGLACSFLFCYIIALSASRCIYIWDESIYANNAVEMAENGNLLVYHVHGQPDNHNSKPPLVLWLEALAVKLFGCHEWVLRLPSYFALAGTVLLLCRFAARIGNVLYGLVASLILLGTKGAMRPHVFLTADLDAVLTCICTAIFLNHLLSLKKKEAPSPLLMKRAFILFLAGFLTKSVAVLLLLPALLASYLISGQIVPLLRTGRNYLYAAAFVFFAASWYVIRESILPGYWEVVWFSEFSRLTRNVQPWLDYPRNFYFNNIRFRFFSFGVAAIYLLSPVFFVWRYCRHKKIVLHILVLSLVYLITIYIPDSKLEWYDAPVYPIASLAIGIMSVELFSGLTQKIRSVIIPHLLFTLLIGVFLFYCWQNTLADIKKDTRR